MTNRPKAIGTAAETAVVRTARTRGFPQADRLTLTGRYDRGDIGLAPGVILEVKGGDAARNASDGLVGAWLTETELERNHAGADVAFLVIQRRGVGPANAHRWWAWWRLTWLQTVLDGTDWDRGPAGLIPVRMTLDNALQLVRAAGYGDPLNSDEAIDELRHRRLITTGTRRDVPGLSRACSAVSQCDHEDLACPPGTCDWSGRDGRDG